LLKCAKVFEGKRVTVSRSQSYSNQPPSPHPDLPTMYDLPSEFPEESGLPDRFHTLQPRLLELTFRPPEYLSDRVFMAWNLCVYYDIEHTLW